MLTLPVPSAKTCAAVSIRRLFECLALGVPLSLFGVLALYQLTLPGLYYDEAADAVPAMQLLLGQRPELVRQAGVELFGRTFPLMVMDYVGAVHTYASLPFFTLLGVGTAPLRLMTITGGALTLVLAYAWTRWLFRSRWIAFAATLLLAVHPSYVFYVRQGVHVSSLMALWLMAALLLLLTWHRTQVWWWLVPAALFLGLGLSTKILFLWFIVALVAIYLLWRGAQTFRWLTPAAARIGRTPALSLGPGAAPAHPSLAEFGRDIRETPRIRRITSPFATAFSRVFQAGSVAVAFLAGASMLVLYNLQTGGTLEVLLKNAEVSQYGVRNTDYFTNLLARLETLRALLDGGHFWFLGGLFGNPWHPPVFLLAAAAVLAVPLWRPQARKYLPGGLYLLALILFVLAQSPLTVSGIWPTHLFSLLPLLQVVIALGLYLLGRYLLPGKGLGTVSALLGALAVSSLWVGLQYHDALSRTGGLRGHSDAVYRLASYLEEREETEPIAMDWGIRYNVQIVTQGRVNPPEIFQYAQEPNEVFLNWLYGALTKSQRLYLFHAPDYTLFPRFDAFTQLAERLGKEVRLETTIGERDGTPVYLVYSAR